MLTYLICSYMAFNLTLGAWDRCLSDPYGLAVCKPGAHYSSSFLPSV
jgi:hypothetical protein